MEAAFFDLDKTHLPGSSLFPLAREMYRQRYFGLRDIWRLAADQVRYRMIGAEAQGPMERAREATLEVIRGRARDEVIAFGRSVAREEILPRLYPQAVDVMSRHKRAGRAVYIASSSPQAYLELPAPGLAGVGLPDRATPNPDRLGGRSGGGGLGRRRLRLGIPGRKAKGHPERRNHRRAGAPPRGVGKPARWG